jgi:hypothetical protein
MNRGSKQPPCAALLRVGLDTDLGGIWGPITDTGELTEKRKFEFIPFPNWPTKRTAGSKTESELQRFGVRLETYEDIHGINHPDKKLSDFLPTDEIRLRFRHESWSPPDDIVPHNDPNFRYATFGDYWKSSQGGRLPSAWRAVDPGEQELHIFFAETLAPFSGRLSFRDLRRQQRRLYSICIVGAMRVSEFVDVSVAGWDRAIDGHEENRSPIVENFHFRRLKDEPVIVIGVPDQTFLAKQAVPLKVVTDARTEITEAGSLLGVTEKDQVRLKFIRNPDLVERLLGFLR